MVRLSAPAVSRLGISDFWSPIPTGSCQFPTLGFVVDRYFRVQNFVPEKFWSIAVGHTKDGAAVKFNWARYHLFDRASVVILYERCLVAKKARVTSVQEKPTKKWKPLPLTTVELQKMATRFLHMTGQEAMTVAENLYNQGFISYPRTETDRFDKGMNLRALVQRQTQDNRWGPFAQNLVDGAFNQPRNGRHDDKAHPPHPPDCLSRARWPDGGQPPPLRTRCPPLSRLLLRRRQGHGHRRGHSLR